MPAPHHSVFTGRKSFLSPNQQRQSTEDTNTEGVSTKGTATRHGRKIEEKFK